MEKQKSTTKKKHSEIAQVIRFGLVGILNTVVDFLAYNLILFFIIGFPPVIASIISGTLAMINSFIFNKNFTFRAKKLSPFKLVLFFVLTIIGLYVIRPLIVYFFTGIWLWPSQLIYHVSASLHLSLTQDFISHNVALVAAIAIVLVYNYLTYKYFVFDEPDK